MKFPPFFMTLWNNANKFPCVIFLDYSYLFIHRFHTSVILNRFFYCNENSTWNIVKWTNSPLSLIAISNVGNCPTHPDLLIVSEAWAIKPSPWELFETAEILRFQLQNQLEQYFLYQNIMHLHLYSQLLC